MFHCRSQQRSGCTSSESLAFQEVYRDLVTATMYNTHSLANALYTKRVISSSVRDEACLETSTPEMKASVLLRAVEAKVKINPKQFMTFVSTLREHENLSITADRLIQAKGILYCNGVSIAIVWLNSIYGLESISEWKTLIKIA